MISGGAEALGYFGVHCCGPRCRSNAMLGNISTATASTYCGSVGGSFLNGNRAPIERKALSLAFRLVTQTQTCRHYLFSR